MGVPPTGPQHTKPRSRRRLPGWVLIPATVMGVIVVLALVILLLFLATGGDDNETAESTTTTTTTTVAETTTTVPETTTTTAPAPPPAIPGLTATSIHQSMTAQGWFCGPPREQPSPDYVMSQCSLPTEGIGLELFATPADEAVFVTVSVLFSTQYQWLELVAALPWDGAEPEAARSWVQQVTAGLAPCPDPNDPDPGLCAPSYTNTFGGVLYEIIGQPELGLQLTLEIGEEPAST
jgi:hypothetical protein